MNSSTISDKRNRFWRGLLISRVVNSERKLPAFCTSSHGKGALGSVGRSSVFHTRQDPGHLFSPDVAHISRSSCRQFPTIACGKALRERCSQTMASYCSHFRAFTKLLLHNSPVPHSGTIHSNIEQGQRAMVPIFARNTFLVKQF